LMRELGIRGLSKGPRKPRTTIPDAAAPPAPDRLNRDFSAASRTPSGVPTSPTCRPGKGSCFWAW
jgi:hypothetical protein